MRTFERCRGIIAALGVLWGAGLVRADATAPARARSLAFLTVSVVPAQVTVSTGSSQAFSCAVVAGGGTSCAWSVEEGAAGGSVTGAGFYTAPTTVGTYHLIAANPANAAEKGRATVSVIPAPAGGAGGTPGVWQNVTPPGVILTDTLSCGNFGTKGVVVDPLRPQDVYVEFNCQGIWKSTNYGQTWSGPINTGVNGAVSGDCTGMLAVAPGTPGSPVLYQSCIRGAGLGFWRSTDGGVDWERFTVGPFPAGAAHPQEFYAPAVDPDDGNHLLMAGHAMNLLVESVNGGQSWAAVPTTSAMLPGEGTGGVNFVNTGVPATTRQTWLWLANMDGGNEGAWRTANGATGTDPNHGWTRVDSNEHVNGSVHSEVYQPGTSGVMFMAGLYSGNGWGVLRSTDYGAHWAHVGNQTMSSVILGTSKHLYALYGWGAGAGQQVDPSLEVSPDATGGGTWTSPGTPAGMSQGPGQGTVTSDGSHNILLIGCYNAGLWRYVEP